MIRFYFGGKTADWMISSQYDAFIFVDVVCSIWINVIFAKGPADVNLLKWQRRKNGERNLFVCLYVHMCVRDWDIKNTCEKLTDNVLCTKQCEWLCSVLTNDNVLSTATIWNHINFGTLRFILRLPFFPSIFWPQSSCEQYLNFNLSLPMNIMDNYAKCMHSMGIYMYMCVRTYIWTVAWMKTLLTTIKRAYLLWFLPFKRAFPNELTEKEV